MAKKKSKKSTDTNESITKRLDGLIRILLETLYEDKKKFNEAVAVRTLHSSGLSPTEIAKILGKKGGAQAVSQYIYSKNKPTKKSKKLLNSQKEKEEEQ
jgi:hypothetical protein